MTSNPVPSIQVIHSQEIGAFSWRWPANVEDFDHGWAITAGVDGRTVRLRHGIGSREVYGRCRVHSVTWVSSNPTVEGVEADDFESSQSLVSLIKETKSHIRPGEPLPPPYESFDVVVFSDSVSARFSPRSLGVKLRVDDINGWVRHAVLRASAWDRLKTS